MFLCCLCGTRSSSRWQYDEDDDEADKVWAAIDERMNSKRKHKKAADDVVVDTKQ